MDEIAFQEILDQVIDRAIVEASVLDVDGFEACRGKSIDELDQLAEQNSLPPSRFGSPSNKQRAFRAAVMWVCACMGAWLRTIKSDVQLRTVAGKSQLQVFVTEKASLEVAWIILRNTPEHGPEA